MKTSTHRLIIRLNQNEQLSYYVFSYQEALDLYDSIKQELPSRPWGYTVEPTNSLFDIN